MKKIILLLIWTICSYQCSSQKINTMSQNNSTPKVTKTFETFDSVFYKNHKDKFNSVNIKTENGDYFQVSETHFGFAFNHFPSNSYFILFKNFYKNKNIHSKGLICNSRDFQKGIWYYYNEDGSFSHEVDYDAPYKFTWENIVQYCKDNKIALKKGYVKGGWITRINRSAPPAKPEWVIEHYVLGVKGYVETIILDGVTGMEIERTQRDLPGE